MWNWLGGTPARPDHEVVMYTRQGCHLCDDAWQLLERARGRHGFDLSKVDIDTDPELVRQFDQCVPVVVIDGKVRFRGRVNAVLLERILNAPSRADDREQDDVGGSGCRVEEDESSR